MNVIKNNLYLFKFINKYAKPYYLYIIFAGITSALSVVMEVYGLQLIVDGLTRGGILPVTAGGRDYCIFAPADK